MIQNIEYRNKLIEGINGYQKEYERLLESNEPFSRTAQALAYKGLFQTMLKEYDRFHTSLLEVKLVTIDNKIRDIVVSWCVNSCTIQLENNTLNMELK